MSSALISLTDAMNMMADYGFTRTLIVTDSMLTKLGMAGDVQKALENAIFLALFMMAPQPNPTTEKRRRRFEISLKRIIAIA